MQIVPHTYVPGHSVIHTADPRVKLVLLLAYSVTLFFVTTWAGLLLCMAACLAAWMLAKIPFSRMASLLIPLYVILAFTIVFNSFSLDVLASVPMAGPGDVSAGLLEGVAPVAIAGSFGFVPAGFARGCFYALRIVFLVFASLVVSLTTASTDLTDALADFLRPLRRLRVPVDDAAMMVSLALRFIPVTAEEISRLYTAQKARGAAFDDKGALARLKAWQTVLIPLFVGLFRRADSLALAMESRCYGMAPKRTQLHPRRFTAGSALALALGIAACASLALLL